MVHAKAVQRRKKRLRQLYLLTSPRAVCSLSFGHSEKPVQQRISSTQMYLKTFARTDGILSMMTRKGSLYRVLTSRLRIAVLTADACSSRVVYSKRNCVSANVTSLLLVCAMQEDIIDARLTSFKLRKKIFLG